MKYILILLFIIFCFGISTTMIHKETTDINCREGFKQILLCGEWWCEPSCYPLSLNEIKWETWPFVETIQPVQKKQNAWELSCQMIDDTLVYQTSINSYYYQTKKNVKGLYPFYHNFR